ncbi:MAG: hypothetical protein E7554_06205 [Ruminococcaceae bacterium]|nr:hypothetical protein [Oscillospiraceae bacterium]
MNLTEKQKKLIVDTVTVVLLIGAFALAFYTGLVGKKSTGEPMIDLNIFSIIAVLGSLVLMGVGGVSEMISRIKNNTVTWSFTAFMAVQAVAFVGMCAIVIGLNSGAFSTDSGWIRGLFLCFVAVQVLGYIQAVIYSNTLEGNADGADESEDEAETDEEFDEDVEEPEEAVED